MTLLIDPRAGSGPLLEPLRAAPHHLPALAAQLSYGDISLVGNGPGGRPVAVGVEYKKLSDVLACISDKRFAGHQLPGLQASFEVVYLLVEGRFKPGPERELMVYERGAWRQYAWGKRVWRYDALDHWLMTMEIKAGVRVRRTEGEVETLQFIHDLYSWWTATAFEEHRSHLAVYLGGGLADRVYNSELPRAAKGLMAMVKGLGEGKARAIVHSLGSISDILGHTPEEIAKSTTGVGEKLAGSIWGALRTRQ